MKILHIMPTYYPATYWGGPIFTVWHLNNALAGLQDVELKVLTTDAAGPRVADRLEVSDLDRKSYPSQEVIFTRRIAVASGSPGLLKRLPRLVRWADVVHLTATYSFPTIPTIMVCRLYEKPLVWSLRGAVLDDDAWMCLRKKRLKRLWLKLCNALIRKGTVCLHVTSAAEKQVSLPRIPRADATIVKNGVTCPATLPERKWLPDGRLRLLFLGRLAPKKGIENLLEAMKLLKADTTVSLTLCGAGEAKYEARVKKRAGILGLSENKVRFTGHVDGAAKTAAFLEADVCVVPSFSENFCIVVAEALAHGVPVIVSSSLPQWQDVEKHSCGLWVGNDPVTLSRSIRKIRNMNLSAMGQRGLRWMKEEFGWKRIGREMFEVYKKRLIRSQHGV